MRLPEYRIQEGPITWVLQEKVGETWHNLKVFYHPDDAERYKRNLEILNQNLSG